jgi:ATP-dependent Clp protease adaptor protein ClpS
MKTMASQKPRNPTAPRERNRPARGDDSGVVVMERRPQRVKPPRLYQVLMLNDDYTPMEFVVVVIQEFFGKDRETATQIMLKIHLDGKGVCGVYSRDVAPPKSSRCWMPRGKAGHPLQCVSEPVE